MFLVTVFTEGKKVVGKVFFLKERFAMSQKIAKHAQHFWSNFFLKFVDQTFLKFDAGAG